MDCPCGILDGQAERFGNVHPDRLTSALDIQTHRASKEEPRVQIAENEVGIGDRRMRTAAPVASGTGVGPCTFRTDLDQAEAINTGNAATTGADLDEVDRGHPDGQATAGLEAVDTIDFELGGDRRNTPGDEAGLGRGATHVE